MKLGPKKKLAIRMLGAGRKRVKFNEEKLSEIKEAITRRDIHALVKQGVIIKEQKDGHSRSGARKIILQRRKGRRQGKGSRQGFKTARLTRKHDWISRIRAQRKFLQELKQKKIVSTHNYRILRNKAKGGFFRSVRHIKLFMNEYNLVNKKKNEKTEKI
ncbi:MAG: 50S ribosomal protein L19e [Candidatus Nanoarchaeia archaeon]